MLIAISVAIRIDCDYFSSIDRISECRARHLEVTSQNETVTSVSGTLSDIIDYDHIRTFRVVSSPNLEYLPKGLEKFFPKLENLIVHHTALKLVTADDLKGFPKLKTLSLRDNQLEQLEPKLFELNENIQEIDLNGNKLKNIDVNMFKHLEHLKKVNLSGNVCINETASDVLELKKLQLRIRDNCAFPSEFNRTNFLTTLVLLSLIAIIFVFVLISCIKYVVER